VAAVTSSARRSPAAVAAGTVAAVLGSCGAGVATPGHWQTVRSYWTRGVETRRALRPSHARTNTPVHFRFSGVTSRRQRRQCRGARGPKRRFELALEVQRWTRARSECFQGPKNYSYATVSLHFIYPTVQHPINPMCTICNLQQSEASALTSAPYKEKKLMRTK